MELIVRSTAGLVIRGLCAVWSDPLMLDTMQSRQHFEMRDEVSKSHLLQHSDYMMKLRPLMKRESGSDFHTTIWYNRYGKYGYEQRGLAAYVYS